MHIIEFVYLHAAFIAVLHFLHIILETAQGSKISLIYNDIVPQYSYFASALDFPSVT